MIKLAKFYLKHQDKFNNAKIAARSVIVIITGIFIMGIVNMVSNGQNSTMFATRKKQPIERPVIEEKSNLSKARSRAIDSLIDNRQLTVENLKKIKELYPDSLCDCN